MFWKTMIVQRNYGPIERMAHQDLAGITDAGLSDFIKYPRASLVRVVHSEIVCRADDLWNGMKYWAHWFRELPERAIEKAMRVFIDKPMAAAEKKNAEKLRKKLGG